MSQLEKIRMNIRKKNQIGINKNNNNNNLLRIKNNNLPIKNKSRIQSNNKIILMIIQNN